MDEQKDEMTKAAVSERTGNTAWSDESAVRRFEAARAEEIAHKERTTVRAETTSIVSALIGAGKLSPHEVLGALREVHAALTSLGAPAPAAEPAQPLVPAVPIKKSVRDEYIVSLEDGRKLKSLKRYLATLGMTPDQYRAKWGLPGDYPMVAPAYAKQRSELAKSLGLGRKPANGAAEAAAH